MSPVGRPPRYFGTLSAIDCWVKHGCLKKILTPLAGRETQARDFSMGVMHAQDRPAAFGMEVQSEISTENRVSGRAIREEQ